MLGVVVGDPPVGAPGVASERGGSTWGGSGVESYFDSSCGSAATSLAAGSLVPVVSPCSSSGVWAGGGAAAPSHRHTTLNFFVTPTTSPDESGVARLTRSPFRYVPFVVSLSVTSKAPPRRRISAWWRETMGL